MAANGVNAVRTYTVPPRWLLDLAQRARPVRDGRPAVGAARRRSSTTAAGRAAIEQRVREIGARPARATRRSSATRSATRSRPRSCAGTAGGGSSASWSGSTTRPRSEDPDALVTYVNYPSTEYLQLPFIDLVCFNVFLESGPQFESYLARLQNIAGDRPLLVTEAGLDSLRNSEEAQARALDWQVRTAFAAGCAGMFVFSWTDEWYRGGFDIDDWAFGLVDRDRAPKQALATVGKAFAEMPFRAGPGLAADLGGRLRVQQRGHAAQLLRRAARRSTIPTTR